MDWPRIIGEIKMLGRMRLLDIAVECDCSEATISDLFRGRTKEPKFVLGSKILVLRANLGPEIITDSVSPVVAHGAKPINV